MKKKLFTLLLLFPLWGLAGLLWGCSDDDDNASQNPIDQLPEATQEGKNTIGCLVDGEVLLPRGGGLSGNTNSFYQYVDEEYFFLVAFVNNKPDTGIIEAINLRSQPGEIQENQTYLLTSISNSGIIEEGRGADYRFLNSNTSSENIYSTNSEVTGELEITKLDTQNGIVSGTFWFDAVNAEGDVVEIREGRFDMLYTD